MGAAASHWQFLRKMKGEGDFFFSSTVQLHYDSVTLQYTMVYQSVLITFN